MPEVITDTSPIQYLYQTNLLDLLPTLYDQIIMPQAVADELAQGQSQNIPQCDRFKPPPQLPYAPTTYRIEPKRYRAQGLRPYRNNAREIGLTNRHPEIR